MARVRTHNEYFRPFAVRTIYGGNIGTNAPYRIYQGVECSRKSCPNCKAKLEENEFCWTWGEYHNAKFCVVQRFCKSCFEKEVVTPLQKHAKDCGCNIRAIIQNAYGVPYPQWLTLPENVDCELFS